MDGSQLNQNNERSMNTAKHHLSSQLYIKPETLGGFQSERTVHSVNVHLRQAPKVSSPSLPQRLIDEKSLGKIDTVMHRKDVRQKEKQTEQEKETVLPYLKLGLRSQPSQLNKNSSLVKNDHKKASPSQLTSHPCLQFATDLSKTSSDNISKVEALGEPVNPKKIYLPQKQIHKAPVIQTTWNYKGDKVMDVQYDSTEPEDDCVLKNILKLRQKLGWTTEFPNQNTTSARTKDSAKKKVNQTEDTGEYVYCLLKQRNDPKGCYNPYDLQVVSASTAKQSLQYWTVSASYISKVSPLEEKSCEIMPVMDWLAERHLFNKILQLPLFANFRIWKAFTTWKINVWCAKTNNCKTLLTKDLFFADEILQRCLVQIRELCEAASDSKARSGCGNRAIVLIKAGCTVNKSCTYSLQSFCEAQAQQCKYAFGQLESLHGEIGEVISSYFLKVAEKEGAQRLFSPVSKHSVDKPLYAEVAEWRHIVPRFSRFLKLVDKIFEEMLCRLVKLAVCHLREFLDASYKSEVASDKIVKVPWETEVLDANHEYEHYGHTLQGSLNAHTVVDCSGSHSPDQLYLNPVDKVLADIKRMKELEQVAEAVFEVSVVLTVVNETPALTDNHSEKVSSNDMTGVDVEEVLKTDKIKCVLPSQEPFKEMEHEKEVEEEENAMPSSHTKPCAIMSIQPSLEDFSLQIQQVLNGFEQTIDRLPAFSQAPQLSVFVSPPLCDWKISVDKERDLERQQTLRQWPELELLLGMDSSYQSNIADILWRIDNGMKATEVYCQRFQKYCSMVDEAMLIDIDTFLAEQKWTPQNLRSILFRHMEHVEQMKMMETRKRVHMMMVVSLQYQEDCLLYPEALVSTIHSALPTIAKMRNLELLEVIGGALKKLDKDIETVEEFVDYITFLGRITLEMPFLERQYDVLMQMHTIAMDYSIPIAPEELALYQTLVTSFQHLKFTLVFCETRRDDNILRFSVDLGNRLNQLQYDLVHVKTKVKNPVLFSSETIPKVAKEIIQSLTEEVAILSRRAHSYACYRDLLGHSVSAKKSLLAPVERRQANDASAAAVQAELSDIDRDLSLRNLLWEMQDEWEKLYSQWKDTTFDHLNVDGLQKDVNRFTQTIYMLEKGLPENDIVPHLKQRVMDFKLCLPIIVALRNPYLCPRHWEDIEYKLGRSFIKEKNFTLGNLLDLKVFQYKSVIADISSTATNEATLEAILNKVIDLWKSTDFQLVDHQTDTSVVRIIASAAEIMTQLEESQATMATIRSSRYAEPIKHQIEGWGRKLNHFSHTLEEWMMCQKRWLFLEPIFSAGDIQRQLPAEAKLFSQVDKTWKEIMQKTEENPNALKIATAPGVLEILQASNGHLETIQKCLEDYLEMKRMVFPRFYFLSNEDLLDILSQSKDPNSIQLHLAKCFDNIRSLDIQEQAKVHPVVASLRSAEFETIHLLKTVQVRGPVEQWLGNMETAMFNTMKRHLKLGMMDWNPLEFKKWVLSHPGQVVLTVTQIMFYKECGHSFSGTDQNVILNGVFQDLVHHLEELADLTSEPLPPHQQATVGALLTILVHCRDVLTHLFQQKVCKADDFEWTRQLHYEWNEHNSMCYVVQANASFMYGYEYLGCSHRLVITPLTDRCWLTLTGALSLHLGGAPSGPAGTGKTETVKDLAKALGKFCVVFNCSEGLDYKMMGKLFSGMVQSGAWCCFDEFNRIDVEVLSVIASQLQAIKVAKDTQTMRFVFEGRDIRLNASCGVFITMNPSYKGRVDLPDNLKSLFRPVAMMVPDYGLIAEIMLFSEGFKSAKSLSRKIVNLYQLVSTQLSQQDHYDFGMRAIKSVLVMAGQKRRFTALKLSLTEEEESCILIDALLDANLPKLVPEDVSLFKSIMWDLFPAIGIPTSASPRLQKAITTATEILGLQQWPSQAEKVIQLYKQILARHGVMLVGPTGGGKTAVRSILQHALPLLSSVSRKETSSVQTPAAKRIQVESITINPKCITLGELYGQVDPHTLEWSDGLLASTIRAFSKELNQQADAEKRCNEETVHVTAPTKNEKESLSTILKEGSPTTLYCDNIKTDSWRWIIMDGPVDTLWVENLNSVLDDTKTLCLANGERIILPAGMRLIFEVDTLSQASPATISRCAMVYMDPVDLGWMPYIKSWLSRQPKELGEAGQSCLQSLFDRSMSEGLCFVKKNQKMQNFPVPEVAIVTTLCSILAAFFNFLSQHGGLGGTFPRFIKPSASTPLCSQDADAEKGGRNLQAQMNNSDSLGTLSWGISHNMTGIPRHREDYKWFLQKNPGKLTTLLGKLFVFAFTWAVGGVLNHFDDYEDNMCCNIAHDFQTLVQDVFEGNPPHGVQLPCGNRMIFSYFVDLQRGAFVPWEELVPSTETLIHKGLNMSSFSGSLMSAGVTRANPGENVEPSNNLIVTVDTVRFSFLTSLLVLSNQPVLLTGDSGVGKSMFTQSMLRILQKHGGQLIKPGTILGQVFLHNQAKTVSLMEDVSSLTAGFLGDTRRNKPTTGDSSTSKGYHDAVLRSPSLDPLNRTHSVNSTSGRIMASIFQCTARTSSAQIQAHILQKLVKKRKDNLGAPKDKRVLVFVDDVNMPVPDEYGAQPPLELIRQFLELQGVFDTKNLTWRNIEDVTLFAACAPPGGGRHDISTRLLRHFSVIALPHPSVQSLQHIFQVQLGRFLGSRDFVAEVQKCRAPLVSASIAVYQEMCQSLLPTPTKYHYTFNLRDLSKVIQGLQQAHESELISREAAAQLFVHEATRVFHDRLVNDQDRELFHRVLSRELHNYFKVSWPVENLMKEPIIFGDFVDMNVPATRRIYKQIADQRKLQTVLEEYHIRSSSGNSQFFKEAVQHITRAARVFRQPGGHMMLLGLDGTGKVTCASLACYISGCHLYRLAVSRSYSHPDFREDLKKVFKQTGLHRQNTVLLITDSDIVEDSFLEDINCIVNSGEVPGLFDNEEIDGIAVQLNTVAEGSVNDSREELYAFFLKQVRQRLHIAVASSPAGATLRQYCRVHPALLNCCTIDWYSEWTRDALLRVAEIYIHSMDLRDKHKGLQDGVAQVCVDVHHSVSLAVAQYWEEMRRHYYVTPSSFLEFIDTFSRMSQTEKTKIHNIRDRFNNGLSTLSEAAALVRVMQDELVALGPKIEEKSQDIEVLMDKLKKDSEAVEQVRAIVKMEEDIMKEETRIVREYAEQATADLNAVMPMVEKAVSALDALEKSDISEIRVYTSPPDLVLTVMHAVCILLQQKPDWSTAKRLLGDPGFLKRLVSLDKDSLPEKVFLKLRRYSQNPDFTPEKVGLVSVACQSMCLWVLALEHYHEVHKMIEPKQKKVEVAQEALARAQWKLKEKQKSLTKIEEHRLTLQQRYNASVAGKKELAERRELTTQRLQRASVLISALADEKGRWEKSVSDLESKLQGIVGDVMISAACVTYFGGFTAGYRRTLLHTWLGFCNTMGVPVSPAYTLTTAVMEKNQVRHWQNEGLPPDQTSTENAIIVKSAHCWPLLIDPQGQANNWICCMEGKKLHKVFASDPNYMRTVETAIRLGEPVLIQDVGEGLDPALRPVLVKNISSRGGQDLIKIGDTQIEYNHNFRLYLTTWLPNPHFLPAVCNLVKLINFSVTSEGLQEQLLSSVVSLQHPQLEQQHFQLLHSVTADLFLLRQLESRSLLLLQSTEGHILDDQDLIDNLRKSRVTSKEILNRIQVSEATEREIDKVRKKYLPVAQRGALLYFVLADLVQINYMYQFSLEWFNEVFVKAIQDATCRQECPLLDCSEPVSGTLRPLSARSMRRTSRNAERSGSDTADLHLQLRKMMDTLAESIYKEVSLALFADHQLCFSFMVCAGIMRANHNDSMLVESLELLPENEWKIFLHSSVLACTMDVKKVEHRDGVSVEDCPCSPWLSHSIWKQCQYLSTHLTAFSMLCTSLQNNKPQWTSFFKAKNLYHFMCKPYINNTTSQPIAKDIQMVSNTSVPAEEERQPLCITVFKWEGLSAFQKLILIKILKAECLNAAVKDFVVEKIGSKYLESGKITMRKVYEKSTANSPLIFLLSPGMDPASQLLRLSQEVSGGALHLDMVSLGQGQGLRAEELISRAQVRQGHWVFLQNCHLAASFMPRLQSLVSSLRQKGSDVDPQFRLWLSSKPDPTFPAFILQKGIKIAVEPPQGIKNKLLHMFSGGTGQVTESTFAKPGCGPAWKTLLFSLCLFHAAVLERKKYGPQGWNIPYTFMSSDLEVAMLNLEILLVGSEVPWPALRFLTGEIVYGGRVTDPWDRRCLLSILNSFYSPSVLQHSHAYSADGVYRAISAESSLSDCRSYIESLPDRDAPVVLGMDLSAESVLLQGQAQQLLHTIVSMQPRLGHSEVTARDGQSQDEVVLAMAADILKTLPETVETEEAADRSTSLRTLITGHATADQGSDSLAHSALLVILCQEIDRFDHMLRVMHTSLHSFCRAVRGEVLMTEGLEEVYSSLLTMKVPTMWKKCSYESCKPLGSWIEDLVQRVRFFNAWAEQVKTSLLQRYVKPGTPPTEGMKPGEKSRTQTEASRAQPRSFWLSAFFFPQGFLTAVLQNFARRRGVSVDALVFSHRVQPTGQNLKDWSNTAHKTYAFEGSEAPADGVLVFGLYLDGARWDPLSQTLADSLPHQQHCSVPEIHFLPCQISDEKAEADGKPADGLMHYECPLYPTPHRASAPSSPGLSSHFITALALPTTAPPDRWVIRGTALVCQLNE
ncbi:dynein axonemal heavy chain 6 [Amia ocellicauda]|uniref:dynein axonemal heavy chain 6 n=1 Tax=Amia ocellicauda TaxID=2972642 RepID=UPI003463C573